LTTLRAAKQWTTNKIIVIIKSCFIGQFLTIPIADEYMFSNKSFEYFEVGIS